MIMDAKNAPFFWTQPAKETPRKMSPTMATLSGLREYQPTTFPMWYRVLATASMAASAYHGYKRNDSVGWAALWAIAGGILPVFVPVIAVAQGFAKPKKK